MKIVLSAFGNKLRGVMEVPEDTGLRFRLALTQPVVVSIFGIGMDIGKKQKMLEQPIDKICTFEWTGGTFMEKGHPYDKARDYQLIDIS